MTQARINVCFKKIGEAVHQVDKLHKHTLGVTSMVDKTDKLNVEKTCSPVPTKKQRTTSPAETEFESITGCTSSDKSTSFKCKHCSMVLILDSTDTTQELKCHLDVCSQYALVETKSAAEIEKVYEEVRMIALVRHGVSLKLPAKNGVGDIKPESTKTCGEICLELYKNEKQKLKHVFESIPSRVCVTCDIFTDASTIEWLCVSAHYVDHNWKLNSKILNLIRFPPTHYPVFLARTVQNLLEDWGIATKILTITLNDKRCCNSMQKILRSYKLKGALPCEGEFLYVNCCASALDDIAQEAFNIIEDLVCKIREGMKHILMCEHMRQEFVKVAGYSYNKCDCTEGFWLDCPSKWVSTYRMLERILKFREPFDSVMRKEDYESGAGKILNQEQWLRVENICKLLQPLYHMTGLFMGNEYWTANSFFVCIWRTGMGLLEAMKNDDPNFRNLVQKLKLKFDECWECCNVTLACAAIFDPRCKLRYVKHCYQMLDEATAEEKCVGIQNRLQKIFLAYASKRYPSSLSSDTKQASPVLQKFEQWKRDEQLYSINSQLDIYLIEPTVTSADQLDVLSWWKQNLNRFPDLALMAIDILSIPITTFSSDSAFNIGTRFSHKWRSTVLPENAEAQILTRNWLYGLMDMTLMQVIIESWWVFRFRF